MDKITDYTEVIKKGYKHRICHFRNMIYIKSMKLGENLMPNDIAEIMLKSTSNGKYKDLLFNGFTSTFGKLLLLFEIYESCSFEMPSKELNLEHLQQYF